MEQVKGYGRIRRASSYSWETTPVSNIMKWTQIQTKVHRISKGDTYDIDKGFDTIYYP